jgi:hypothetical protein
VKDPVVPAPGAPIPEDLKRKLDETVKIQLQFDEGGQIKMVDHINFLTGYAVKGMLSEIKDNDARSKISKLVEGRDPLDAQRIINAFSELAPKQAIVGGVPVPSTNGTAQPFSCIQYSANARTKK